MSAHEHTADRVGELFEYCACGSRRLNDTWKIPDEGRNWSLVPSEPGNSQVKQEREMNESEPQPS